jgi:hypothetical protein
MAAGSTGCPSLPALSEDAGAASPVAAAALSAAGGGGGGSGITGTSRGSKMSTEALALPNRSTTNAPSLMRTTRPATTSPAENA